MQSKSGKITFYADQIPLEIYYRTEEGRVSLLAINWPTDAQRGDLEDLLNEEILKDIREDIKG